MKRFIEVTKADNEFLMKTFNVSRVMVYYALYYDERRGNSELANKIRNLALQRGGKVMLFVPECETIHTHDGVMTQTFGNGYQLVCDMKSGRLHVNHNGVLVCAYENVSLPKLESIQMEIQRNQVGTMR